MHIGTIQQAVKSMLNHMNWLPEAAEKVELDLEAELRYPLSSAKSSRRLSLGDICPLRCRVPQFCFGVKLHRLCVL